ncbi:MAG TPA: hypothetical protein VMS12_03290 [Thermoanaerobaculia bacterium]|nr:hypothetical protein [Thermoanaerobaculia bacterium]
MSRLWIARIIGAIIIVGLLLMLLSLQNRLSEMARSRGAEAETSE